MARHIAAVVETDGSVQLLEPIHPERPRKAILTVLEDESPTAEHPAVDTVDLEETFRGQPRPRGATFEELLPVIGTLDPADADEMERIIDREFGRVDPDEW